MSIYSQHKRRDLARLLTDVVVELHRDYPELDTLTIVGAVDESRPQAMDLLPDLQAYAATIAKLARRRLDEGRLAGTIL